MPSSITIAAFVLGGVLFLIAVLGGGFKIFSAEITAKAGTAGRIAAGIGGVALLTVGLVGSLRSPSAAPTVPAAAPSPREAPRPAARAPARTAGETVAGPRDIAGTWSDDLGTVYEITQQGDRFSFTASNARMGSFSTGGGTIRGKRVISTFRTNLPSTGQGQSDLSADGSSMTGSFTDSAIGAYRLTFRREQ
jgi:hypothetical protein